MNKLELYRDVMGMVESGKSIIEIIENMKEWKVDSISSKRCTISKWVEKEHICISVFIGNTLKEVNVF